MNGSPRVALFPGSVTIDWLVRHDLDVLIDACPADRSVTCVVCGKIYKTRRGCAAHLRAAHAGLTVPHPDPSTPKLIP